MYHPVTTGDGTTTLFSEEYGQAMHTRDGAFGEALAKHVFPSRILEIAGSRARVLDIGFGLGYNTLALIEEFEKRERGGRVDIVSFEKDTSFLPLMESLSFEGRRGEIYEALKSALRTGQAAGDRFSVTLASGDARKLLPRHAGGGFRAVFHDPYSPSKNPELWTVDFFRAVRSCCDGRAILTTYSSAIQVRRALREAGFRVGKGPAFGSKREGTLASIAADFEELDAAEMAALMEDVKSVPYRDPELSDSREVILERRLAEMRELRIRRDRQAR